MKGFVPVTKQGMIAMLNDCQQEVYYQLEKERDEHIAGFIKAEEKRCAKRRFFGLINPPKPRFAFEDDSVIAYSGQIDYAMFDYDPFDAIEKDAKNSLAWIARLERVAMSEHSGEPVQIDMNTFMRISEPARYYWVRASWVYTLND